jgi:topoisomerase-4 subunit A
MVHTSSPSSVEKSVDFNEALSERYLSYALSTIMARSLPDVRDGLKPVHRRVLYAMHQLKLNPQARFKKSARIVGDVMGKFHPHGDGAIYDTLVRLAQDFTIRYPLIDGQGNFGNIDGDNAAAMRYTEARLTSMAHLLMEGMDRNTVDFKGTYDNESEEPLVLPARFPNLLANGSTGIAVGMATSIPPHNLMELLHGLIFLLNHPNASTKELMEHIPGPDFPTGGVIIDDALSIEKAYETGRGGFSIRATYHIETLERGQYQIVITNIPYLVNKAKLIEKMAALLEQKKLPLLLDFMDESDENIRIVLQPKSKNVDPDVLMESLFHITDLQSRFSLNMNVLDQGKRPEVMGLKKVLETFLAFRLETLLRQTAHRVEEIDSRLMILSGYLVVYLNLDEIIAIIREEDDPKAEFIKRFSLNDTQADAILNMRLRALRSLQEIEIRKEFDKLKQEKESLCALQKSKKLQKRALIHDFKDIEKAFSSNEAFSKRRSQFQIPKVVDLSQALSVEERENITLLFTQKGWIKTLKGHGVNTEQILFKDEDNLRFCFEMVSDQPLIVIASNGRSYRLDGDKIPTGRTFKAMARVLLELESGVDIVHMFPFYDQEQKYLIASSDQRGFLVEAKDFLAQTKAGRVIMSLGNNARLSFCIPILHSHIAFMGDNRKLLIVDHKEIPVMSRGKGVFLQRLNEASIHAITTLDPRNGLCWKKGERHYKEGDITLWIGKRATPGRLAPMGFPRSNTFDPQPASHEKERLKNAEHHEN